MFETQCNIFFRVFQNCPEIYFTYLRKFIFALLASFAHKFLQWKMKGPLEKSLWDKVTVLLVLPTDSQIDSADHLQPLSTNGPSYCTFSQDKTSSTSFYKTKVYATTRKYDNHWQDLSGKTSIQKLAESGLSDWNPISAKSCLNRTSKYECVRKISENECIAFQSRWQVWTGCTLSSLKSDH